MGPGYAKSAREHAPQAIIAIDPYHVVALSNRALDEVRRDYWNELRRLGDRDAARRFKDARWSLLKAPQNLTGDQAATLRRLKHAGGEVWRAYTLKEALRAIFAPSLTLQDVTILIDRFISKATRSRLAPFVRLGQTIRRHRDGILQAIRLGINQGRTEALNNKVRLITRRAYGFHSADAALALVMLTCGPITLTPPRGTPVTRDSPTSMPGEPLFTDTKRRSPDGALQWNHYNCTEVSMELNRLGERTWRNDWESPTNRRPARSDRSLVQSRPTRMSQHQDAPPASRRRSPERGYLIWRVVCQAGCGDFSHLAFGVSGV